MHSRSKHTLLLPGATWLLILFIVPLVIILWYSFLERGPYGEVVYNYSLDNYFKIFDPLYAQTLWRSAWIASVTTVVTLLLGYPVAWYIAQRGETAKKVLLALLILPFWTNFLVRTYSWIFILRTEGLLNNILIHSGIIDQPLNILFSQTAVIIGLVYTYLPFMILPIYVSIEKLDKSILDATKDLGASAIQTFRHVVLPLTKVGIISGCVLVFVPAFGAYITPDLLGGAKNLMIGNLIQIQFLSARDWPFGSALSLVVMIVVMMLLMIQHKIDRNSTKNENS